MRSKHMNIAVPICFFLTFIIVILIGLLASGGSVVAEPESAPVETERVPVEITEEHLPPPVIKAEIAARAEVKLLTAPPAKPAPEKVFLISEASPPAPEETPPVLEEIPPAFEEPPIAVAEAPMKAEVIPPAVEIEPPEDTVMTYLGQYYITGYDICVSCCGKTDGITASGAQAEVGRTVAANDLPFGTRLYIDGIGERVVEDRGGMSSNVIDVLCIDHPECYSITGTYDVYIIEE